MSKKVFTVSNAHLDTIWSWDFETTVKEYIYNTLVDNFHLFEKYKDYRFNFEGSYRYELMEEYYPDLFEKVKRYVKEGRWNVTGSAYENGDVNVPSPEALFRNILYGNGYFEKTFGKTSADIFLPDCFGFGRALPSIARHAGLKGFSTQKLTWGSAYEVPFDLGKWYGVDGNFVYASLKMNSYTHTLSKIRNWKLIENKLKNNEQFGLDFTAVYHGTGDRGGAPKERGIKVLEKEIKANGNSDIEVLSASPDELYNALEGFDKENEGKLPEWNNELLMSTHAVGSYVSRSVSKRWNRKGEDLADMTERAAVCANLLGRPYPQESLEKCWKRIIRHQFHDDITGTSVQRAYRRVWNDYALSIKQLIGEYESAAGYIADRLDTSWVKGTAVVVNNPCEYTRKDIIEIEGCFTASSYIATDRQGNTYPCQKTANGLIFIAAIPSLGYKVFDISDGIAEYESNLSVSKSCIENKYIKAVIGEDGWVSSIVDKASNKELLKQPIKLALYDYEGSKHWPAWEIPNDAALGTPHYPKLVKSEIIENGAVRASIKLEYEYAQSRFTTVISLTENGEALEFRNEIIWHEFATLAKQEFSLNTEDELATFDLGLGAIQRGNRTEKLYEVPAQKWADLGNISIISDSKASWDKFDDSTLRLTVLHTPKRNYRIDSMQSMMDLGLNRYGFAVTAHADGDFSKTNRLAKNFHQPMPAFICEKHAGELGGEISFGRLESENVVLRAMKKAEDSDSIVLRFNEINCSEQKDVKFIFNTEILLANEVLASEKEIGKADYSNNALSFDLGRYGVKSFAVSLKKADGYTDTQTPVELDGNAVAYSSNNDTNRRLLPECKLSLPAELVKNEFCIAGVNFRLNADKKALLADGRTVSLPDGTKRAYLLCGSLTKDKTVEINGKAFNVNAVFENYAGWDLYDYGETAFIKDGRLGFEFTHTHTAEGDAVAKQAFFQLIEVEVKDNILSLPDDNDILVLALTADSESRNSVLASELFEKVERRGFNFVMTDAQKAQYKKYKRFKMMNDKGRYFKMMNK